MPRSPIRSAPTDFRLGVTEDQHTTLPTFVGQMPDDTIRPVWASRTVRDTDGRERSARAAAA